MAAPALPGARRNQSLLCGCGRSEELSQKAPANGTPGSGTASVSWAEATGQHVCVHPRMVRRVSQMRSWGPMWVTGLVCTMLPPPNSYYYLVLVVESLSGKLL